MILKRNVLAMALASAGLCFTVGIQAAPAGADNGAAAATQPAAAPAQDAQQSGTAQTSDQQDGRKQSADDT